MQGGSVVVRNNFNHSFRLQTLHETVRPADRPMKNIAPTPVAAQAFASFTHTLLAPVIGIFRFGIVHFHKQFQESLYVAFMVVAILHILCEHQFGNNNITVSGHLLKIEILHI